MTAAPAPDGVPEETRRPASSKDQGQGPKEQQPTADLADTATFFSPPLWFQRRAAVLRLLKQGLLEAEDGEPDAQGDRTILDIGCGEGALLQVLLNDCTFAHLLGLDLNLEGELAQAARACLPTPQDHAFLRELPIALDLYAGNVRDMDARFIGCDVITCVEVIEHLDPDALEALAPVLLGCYRPALLVVTTPNAEFNIHFPALHYGTERARFRHDDHRFEWTRAEFQAWATQAARAHQYAVRFEGVGLPYRPTPQHPDVGHCTQIAVFTRIQSPGSGSGLHAKGEGALELTGPPSNTAPHAHYRRIVYPCFDQTRVFADAEVVTTLKEHIPYMVADAKRAGEERTMLPLHEFWSILPIRQMCKHLPALRAVLRAFPEEFRLVGEVVKLLYEVPTLPEEEEEEGVVVEGEDATGNVEMTSLPMSALPPGEEGVVEAEKEEDSEGEDAPLAYEEGEGETVRLPHTLASVSLEEVQARLDALLQEGEERSPWSGPQMSWGDAVPTPDSEPPGGRWASPSPTSTASTTWTAAS